MTNTDQAFIKAYRRDTANVSTPAPASSKSASSRLSAIRHAAVATGKSPSDGYSQPPTAWQSTVEYVGPVYPADFASLSPPAINPVGATTASGISPVSEPTATRRPLSAFIKRTSADQLRIDEPPAEPSSISSAFQPETIVPAFRWPSVCRAAWQRSATDYERVADLIRKQSTGGRRLIGVAGLRPGDGCTTTLLCLAAAMASSERRVILIDANFTSPQLAIQLGIEPTAAWQDVLEHGLSVAQAVIRAERDCVDLLPLDARRFGGPQLAAGLQTSITAGVLRYAYDVVLLDLGAILAPASFAATVHLLENMQIDGALLVADRRRSDKSDLAMAADLLNEHGCEPLGIIENRAA